MHIKRICLTNWMRYAGSHVLELKPTVYGIVGEWLGEEGRSNWSGKSTLCEAVSFALTGDHRHRTEDEWITNGEESGGVTLDLSDGTHIQRTRKLGEKTACLVDRPGEKYKDKEADRFILDSVLGCTKDEYYLLYYAKQKELAQLVMMKPEQFADTIRQWVGTGPLEAVESEACSELARCSDKVRELEQTIMAATADAMDGNPAGDGGGVVNPVVAISLLVEAAESAKKSAEADVAHKRAALRSAREAQQECTEWYEHKAAVGALASSRAELMELENRIARVDEVQLELDEVDASTDDQNAIVHARGLRTQCDRLEALARGEFDGACPVTGDKCPVPNKVLEAGNKNRERLLTVKEQAEKARAKQNECRNKLDGTRAQLNLLATLRAQAEALTKAIASGDEHQAFLDANPEPEDSAAVTQEVVDAEEALGAARLKLQEAEQKVARLARRLDEVKRAVANIGDARAMMARYNRIRRAAGRQGAQRDIALSSMRRVQGRGNEMLAAASIPLTFSVRWTQEGKKLASACDACGHQFTGQRDKACPRCKAERGMQALDRPGLEMSERSGAAEDLVGAALRMGASAWLRRKRAMPWSVMVMDEPLGSLDEALRLSFAQYVVTSLTGRFGFEQSFLITHSPDVNSAFPSIIRVTGTQHGSRAEVVY